MKTVALSLLGHGYRLVKRARHAAAVPAVRRRVAKQRPQLELRDIERLEQSRMAQRRIRLEGQLHAGPQRVQSIPQQRIDAVRIQDLRRELLFSLGDIYVTVVQRGRASPTHHCSKPLRYLDASNRRGGRAPG